MKIWRIMAIVVLVFFGANCMVDSESTMRTLDDDDQSTDTDTLSVDGYLRVEGNTLAFAKSLIPKGSDCDSARWVGYGLGGTGDWAYSAGLPFAEVNGMCQVNLGDGLYRGNGRISGTDSDPMNWIDLDVVSSSSAYWVNDNGSAALCFFVQGSTIEVASDSQCESTGDEA